MARLVIKNLGELKAFQSKIRTLEASFPFIQKKAITKFSNEKVLDEIKAKMNLKDFSKKIIDATFVGPVVTTPKKIQVHYISNYESETGFDVSSAREEGTTHPNPTVPKKKGGTLRWTGPGNETIFRKKSHPKGMERLLIIEKTIKENENQAETLYGENIAEESAKVLGV